MTNGVNGTTARLDGGDPLHGVRCRLLGAPILSVLLPLLFLFLATTSGPLHAQSVLTGTVLQDSLRTALGGVEVLVEGANRQTVTDATGRFELRDLSVGTHIVLFRLPGFRPLRTSVRLQSGVTTRIDTIMVRESVQTLDSITVTGKVTRGVGLGREAFEERRAMGFGRFIDSEELRRSEHRSVADIFRALPGVNVVRFRECLDPILRRFCSPLEDRVASGRGVRSMNPTEGMEYCWMSVYMDGTPVYLSGSSMKVPDFSRDVRVTELEMVEVYRSAAETPGQYSGTTGGCGVVLLWTRRAP
ncbi:MAG: carboxypeptidase-like regulatory domain-containing protein [Gemmatimonadales bacterium]|nr:carboxypeptidase-like regulatory domain-containing protein [Gemmatimonadales bacterium]